MQMPRKIRILALRDLLVAASQLDAAWCPPKRQGGVAKMGELRQRVCVLYRTLYVEVVHKRGQQIGVKNEEPDIAAVLASKETKLTPRDAFDSWKRVGRSQIKLSTEIPSRRTKAGLGSGRIGHV